jgi:hypothetical protein
MVITESPGLTGISVTCVNVPTRSTRTIFLYNVISTHVGMQDDCPARAGRKIDFVKLDLLQPGLSLNELVENILAGPNRHRRC